MPAPFAADLCGYRGGKPNTSDASEAFSVELGTAMFDAMGVDRATAAPKDIAKKMSRSLADDLQARLTAAGRDLEVLPEQRLLKFDQFRHLGALGELTRDTPKDLAKAVGALRRFAERRVQGTPRDLARMTEHFAALDAAITAENQRRVRLLDSLGDEALLGLDVTASRDRGAGLPHLEIGLSLKWSLRTDRAQDCRSQGARMSSLRRGRMPHFAAVTMEPRPYMLNILGGGSGEVDCVYHLHLPALTQAIDDTCAGRGVKREKTRSTLLRLVDQGRLRDYDDLAAYALTV